MTRLFIALFATLSILCTQYQPAQAQEDERPMLRIGNRYIPLRAPHHVYDDRTYTPDVPEAPAARHYRKVPRHFVETFIGFGFPIPSGNRNDEYFPIYSGSSFHMDFGIRQLYRVSSSYRVGTILQYTGYSYRLKNLTHTFMDYTPEGDIYREFFRTDNISAGFVQHFHVASKIYIEAIAFGEFAYSKRYKVKAIVDGKRENTKFRDGTRYNNFQVGAQIGLRCWGNTFYARYRFTNLLNTKTMPMELPRWSLGLNIAL